MYKILRIGYLFFILIILIENGFAQDGKSFEFVQADQLSQKSNDKGQTVQIYNGNVEFIKGDIYLYCDSVSLYKAENKLQCFGNVKVIKAAAYNFTGDFLEISQQKKKALMKGNVFLSKPGKEIHRKRLKLKLK